MTYRQSPSTVGVERGLCNCSFFCCDQNGATLVFQTCLPLAASKHDTYSSLSSAVERVSPRVYMRPPMTAMLAYPRPAPFVSHNCFGPPLGHSLSKPVSAET